MNRLRIPLTCLCLALFMSACLMNACFAAEPPSADKNLSGVGAFAYVKRLVAFGPRPSGSANLKKARLWLRTRLTQAGCKVREERFTASTPLGAIPMVNLVGEIPGKEKKVIILSAHYETKRFDKFTFVGANDSASGTALVLQLAGTLGKRKNRFTYWMVLFDGEEPMGKYWTEQDSLYGSKRMVRSLAARSELNRIHAVINLDMIGDAQLRLRRDDNSTPWLTDLIWTAAKKNGYGQYFSDESVVIEDDHTPFVRAGISAVDLIDFEYGPRNRYWHTPADTTDKLSPQSLGVMENVVLAALRELEAAP